MTMVRDSGLDAGVDLSRWPAMADPKPSQLRARVARTLLRHVVDHTGIRVGFPDGSSWGKPNAPAMRVINSEKFFTRLGRDGLIGFGESYMAGDWDSDEIVEVLTPMARNMGTLVPPAAQWLRRWYSERHPLNEDNDHTGARKNIARHYDLSNEMFETFLDETMTYSSALFEAGNTDLRTGQDRKVQRILDLAGVTTNSSVLEIGTGWGELSLQAARRGAHVTTVTLSTEQAELAGQRVQEAGLGDRVDIRVQDYRDVEGRFDAIVSVEMIEAVGERWWPTYFRTLDDRLEPGGKIGLQAILMPHDRLMASRRSWTWIHKYIFPGGLLLSEQVIDDVCAEYTSLRVTDRLHMADSYADTLQIWRSRFNSDPQRLDALGFDATFRKMWTFYLAYCEAGFRSGYLNVAQLRLERG
ncbi:MAG TPA: cyclopropane-fatty-acyl-phospholipid synthase family protein [Mycobacteriales bacterium]|nr:cyclopropane-fatty-acyl-phospholipid synthase family protein [Mycobacteriales bacterium]